MGILTKKKGITKEETHLYWIQEIDMITSLFELKVILKRNSRLKMKELVANGQLGEIVNIPWFAVLKKCGVMQEGW